MKKKLFLVLLLLVSFNLIAKEKITSVYTSTSEKDCSSTPKGIFKGKYNATHVYDDIYDGGAKECQGYDKYKVAIPYSDSRTWLDISDGKSIWTTAEIVPSNVGYFPNLRQGSKLEWRINEAKKPTAVIFRIHYQDPNDYKKYVSRLFVVSLRDSEPKFCGYVVTNEEARTLADTGKCTEKLNKIF